MNNLNTKEKIREMFNVIFRILIIYFLFHLSQVCFNSADLLDIETAKNMLFLTISIVIYYLFFDNLLKKF